MTTFDYAVLAVVGVSLLLGFWRGFVSEVVAIAGWLLAFAAARIGAPKVAEWLTGIGDPAWRLAAAMVGIFVLTLLIAGIVGFALRRMLQALGLGLVDRILGAGFGLLRGIMIAVVGVMVGGLTALPKQAWWRDAALSPPLETAVMGMRPWFPADIAKRIRFR